MRVHVRLISFLLLGGVFFSTLLIGCQADMARPEQSAPTRAVSSVAPPVPLRSTDTPGLVTPSSHDFSACTQPFLQALKTSPDSCLPGRTVDDIGVYIYNLNKEQEVVSINADTPFQFASAFKAPLLVYFLSACRKYWDVSSPEWNAYFLDEEAAGKVDWYTSEPYRQKLVSRLADVNGWNHIETFFVENRVQENGVVAGRLDKRYFILSQVFGMVARSGNQAAANVLRFVYDNCLEPPPVIDEQCGGSNPITAFNAWLTDFADLPDSTSESHRGLYEWGIVLETNRRGKWVESFLSTYGLKDACANQFAVLNCSTEKQSRVVNALTAKDFFRFYKALFDMQDERVREMAFALLKIDLDDPSRGNLKNLARAIGAEAVSKNGQAFYSYASIVTDAGILNDHGDWWIVVTLSFNAQQAIQALYGQYNEEGELISAPGLIQCLLVSSQ